MYESDIMKQSNDYRVLVNGVQAEVLFTPVAAFVIADFAGEATIEVIPEFSFSEVSVRPMSHNLNPCTIDQGTIRLKVNRSDSRPLHLSVEFDGDIERPLFLFLGEALPRPEGVTHVFEAGRVHKIGILQLQSNDTVLIEAGATIKGALHAQNAENIRIFGRGILDEALFPQKKSGESRVHLIDLRQCRNCHVEGITVIDNSGWTVVQAGCRNNTIRDVRLITWNSNGDGFDIVSSSDMIIRDCFGKCHDDNVVLKAKPHAFGGITGNVENILVEGCVFWNMTPGNALEIGFETCCEHIRNVTFRDLDIIRVEAEYWQSGAVFSIHNGDRAIIEDVVLENIRVEQARCKLIDLKVTLSQYSRDSERGHIDGVLLKDIAVVDGPLPPSIFQGFMQENLVRNVTIENLTWKGKEINNHLDMHLILERCRDIRFSGENSHEVC